MEDMKQVIVDLINEHNSLEREVTLDNVIISPPRAIEKPTEQNVYHTSPVEHTWTVPGDVPLTVVIELKGAGGGSGGSADGPSGSGTGNRSGAGGNGGLKSITRELSPGDVVRVSLGEGGDGGVGRNNVGGDGEDGGSSSLWINDEFVYEVSGGSGGEGARYHVSGADDGVDAQPPGGSDGGAGVYPAVNPKGSSYSKIPRVGLRGKSGQVRITATPPENFGNRNTAIGVTGIPNRGYWNTTEVFNTRGDMATLFKNVQPTLRDQNFTAQKVLDGLNLRYGLSLTLEDMEDFTLPDFTNAALEDSADVVLSVKEQNWKWVGSVTVKLIHGNPSLGGEILIQLMPVLSHPDDPSTLEDRNSAKLCTYEFDFTPWKDDLQIDSATGLWKDFSKVLSVGERAGLSSWQNGYVVDKPTSEVPEANPRFERVMVQQYARGNVQGPIYFHYDLNW